MIKILETNMKNKCSNCCYVKLKKKKYLCTYVHKKLRNLNIISKKNINFQYYPYDKINMRFKEIKNMYDNNKYKDFKLTRILEIGSGNCCIMPFLLKRIRGVKLSVGTDVICFKNFKIDKEILSLKKDILPIKKVEIYPFIDAANLPFKNNYFNFIYSFEVFEHIPAWKKAILEIHRVLKKKVMFILISDLFSMIGKATIQMKKLRIGNI